MYDLWFWHEGNIQGSGRKFLGHFKRHFGPQIWSESFKQSYQANKAKMWVLSHVCLSVLVCAIDVWSRSSFPVTTCAFPQCWCWQNNRSYAEDSLLTNYNQTHFCCKCGLIREIWTCLIDFLFWFCDTKWRLKSPRNFRPPPWLLPVWMQRWRESLLLEKGTPNLAVFPDPVPHPVQAVLISAKHLQGLEWSAREHCVNQYSLNSSLPTPPPR